MVRITQPKNNKVASINGDRIVWFGELRAHQKNQNFSEFPLLSKEVYEWSKKNKCTYLRTYHLREEGWEGPAFKKAILFKDADKAKQFRAKWLDPLLIIGSGRYEFTNDEYKFMPISFLLTNPESSQWLYKHKMEFTIKRDTWILFKSTKDMLLFKMRWM